MALKIVKKRSDEFNESNTEVNAIEEIPKEEKPIETKNNFMKKEECKSVDKISNPSFYYYKDCNYGKNIESFEFENDFSELYDFNLPEEQIFKLTTIYPGLLVGSGYNHPKLKSENEDFQLGFFFDHTTGLPIISGSSIKGLLKNVCEKTDFMQDVYQRTIDMNIFEDGKTIFYDAFILSTKNKQNKIFGNDFITSHFSNEENGMFKEPNPVKFLKVLPDVTFKFQFKADEKIISLFKKIILDFGLGAKTNVGYGKFRESMMLK